MGFDWIFVNPFHEPGFSGSLYAIKDPDRLHPILQGDAEEAAGDLLGGFTEAARARGISVMMDLVINHTAKDALLVERHPDWFRRESDGQLRSPRAVDPVDPRLVTVWGDLAEIDYEQPALRPAQIGHWSDYIRRHLKLGFKGFRCDAAYQIPAEVWRPLIEAARAADPDCLFCAETLGCTTEQALALKGAGFDYFFNSAKWWDFHADWLLDQYELYRAIAPTIAFPESHDTERLAAEIDGNDVARIERHYRLRYLFAAGFSTGIMMPMGYEFGLGKRLDVVQTRPGDWDWEAARPRFDLRDFIAATNAMKAACPALNVEGPQRRITAPQAPVTGLLRLDGGDERVADDAAVVLVNSDEECPRTIDPGVLITEAGGRIDRFEDITPCKPRLPFETGQPLTLKPLEVRVFRGRPDRRPGRRQAGPSAKESERRLRALAANRVIIEHVDPEIDCGRHPVKRVVGDLLRVSADIFCDGHDTLRAALKYKELDERGWREAPMAFVDNDRWAGTVPLQRNTRYLYTIEAWRDLYGSWQADVVKKRDAGQDLALEVVEGRRLIERTIGAVDGADRRALQEVVARLDAGCGRADHLLAVMLSDEVGALMARCGERTNLTRYANELEVVVDRTAARFAAWYEIFPRSQSGDPDRHGTFRDVIRQLPDIRAMGFDVLYFPPIHPIGYTNRKGRNNSLVAGPDDPGSPYAIGSAEGGHQAVHPELGTLEDFRALVAAAYEHGLEIALDFAIQCSPDHPWLKEHPEWFDWRPDGTIKFAENPPKKYEDIVNVHFYRDAIPGIWHALRDIVLFWVDQGVKTFRVDNPHTKPIPFWDWMIRDVQERHPDVIFLSEAFTRPKMMQKLAKTGFTQSYTYFTWRNEKQELIDYLTELTREEPKEYFRPNFFVNTPDINPYILQGAGRGAYMMRVTLAATLSGLYGVYSGFELCEGTPIPGREEYFHSEKYEIKAWDKDRPGNIRAYIARLNHIRRDNPALHDHLNLSFCNAWNDNILVYARITPALDNIIMVAVNLDVRNAHGAHFEVPLKALGLPDDATVEVEELLAGLRYAWRGRVQHIWLNPNANPCAIWRVAPPRPAP